MQLLRSFKYPVTAEYLSNELNVTTRTIYRDIASLKAEGADIEGEAGIGYVLKPGFLLPPLSFSEEELEALVLGMRWISKKGDSYLKASADNALSKIAAVLPKSLQAQLEVSPLLVGPGAFSVGSDALLQQIRKAIKQQAKVLMTYRALNGAQSTRTIWPLALTYFDSVRIVVAWCEHRCDFRHFRTDRIETFSPQGDRYKTPRHALIIKWREKNNIPDQ